MLEFFLCDHFLLSKIMDIYVYIRFYSRCERMDAPDSENGSLAINDLISRGSPNEIFG